VKRQLEHTEEALVRLHPRDSEGLPIRQTEVSYTLGLYYEGEEKHIFEKRLTAGTSNESNLASVAPQHLRRPGTYHIIIKLSDGWIDTPSINGPCFLPTQMPASSFFIKCAPGYEATGDKENACMRVNFDNKCKAATVHMKGFPTGQASQKTRAKSLIGKSDHLSVTLTGNQTLGGLKIRLVPLKAVLAVNANRGLAITETGDFLVELTDQNSTQSCTLFNMLTIQCDAMAGFEEHKEMCVEREARVRVCAYAYARERAHI
jgi:hypothetical protein